MVALVRTVPWVASIIGGSFEEIPDEYHSRSSIHFVSKINCPLLILHGEKDDVVSVSHALRLAQALTANQKYFEMTLFPDEGHNWSIGAFKNNWRITRDFFNRHLKQAQ
jgi:dipeptidyl aminopeptidase/acylaminoacyl peptidase